MDSVCRTSRPGPKIRSVRSRSHGNGVNGSNLFICPLRVNLHLKSTYYSLTKVILTGYVQRSDIRRTKCGSTPQPCHKVSEQKSHLKLTPSMTVGRDRRDWGGFGPLGGRVCGEKGGRPRSIFVCNDRRLSREQGLDGHRSLRFPPPEKKVVTWYLEPMFGSPNKDERGLTPNLLSTSVKQSVNVLYILEVLPIFLNFLGGWGVSQGPQLRPEVRPYFYSLVYSGETFIVFLGYPYTIVPSLTRLPKTKQTIPFVPNLGVLFRSRFQFSFSVESLFCLKGLQIPRTTSCTPTQVYT